MPRILRRRPGQAKAFAMGVASHLVDADKFYTNGFRHNPRLADMPLA